MIFTPEKYTIADRPMQPFINPSEIIGYLENTVVSKCRVKEVISKSLEMKRLSLEETAVLVKAEDPELIAEIKEGALRLKEKVYGNRIVLFAPLYIGNKCINNCQYCGFRTDNKEAVRKTLSHEEMVKEIQALEDNGQKRLILVFGEHPEYSADFIAQAVQTAYETKKGKGEIRRVNINAAPLDIEGFRKVKQAGIGTYQIFQETYHPDAYLQYHLSGKKRDYANRLISLDRAQEAGIDDVGIGALFGLYDWRFEVLGLVRHANHLEACYNVGPHTISFPRIKDASSLNIPIKYQVSDYDFGRLVAILRLAVPYTGMILTARESPVVRKEVMKYGVSQIDGGTKLEIGAYSQSVNDQQNLNREQFFISDSRTLDEIIEELLDEGFIPSFCTACYRLGRTGEHFMEISVPGFIHNYCTPNAMLTLSEYLVDYASENVRNKGWKVIKENEHNIESQAVIKQLHERIDAIKNGKRDLFF
ncbi:MAG: [FeFe] hydrogenase H-cluster radical SAM maturase HydG [Rikenellaceae bacterium]|nr:[FeFe] hydrogenase H-cluster radical SAM maturase HydG [Rikenellaceae bacterium]